MRRVREKPHDWAWHLEQMKHSPDLQKQTDAVRQLGIHDRQPPRLRELVREHSIKEGIERWHDEQLAEHAPRRLVIPASTLDDEPVKRRAGMSAAEILARARKRGMDV